MLFGGDGGLVAAAGKGERLAGIGMADAKGLASVLTVGAERAAADAVRPGGTPDRPAPRGVQNGTLVFTRQWPPLPDQSQMHEV